MPATTLTSDTYRRKARRLRALHRGDAESLHRSLRTLARSHDHAAVAQRPTARVPEAVDAVRNFAANVAQTLEGSTLLYSRRTALLEAARRHGIRRFDANLIIAAVQERARPSDNAIPMFLRISDRSRGMPLWAVGAAVVILVQALILTGAKWMLAF